MSDLDTGPLGQLQRWYAAQCNGDWEHTYGISIETVDNPGWYFKVELTDTYLAGRAFAEISENRADEKNAFICMVRDRAFVGSCAPNRLHEVIAIFLRWADSPA
jgi:hypothetical protein